MSGTASDNYKVITQVTWSNNRGGTGAATGTTSGRSAASCSRLGPASSPSRAWDEAGNTGTDTLTVIYSAPTISVTVATSPTGRSITVDGVGYTAPQTFTWPHRSSHTIATTSPQAGTTGTRYVFANWSDGSTALSRTVAPTGTTTYTANFTTRYLLTLTASPTAGGSINRNPFTVDGYYDAGAVVQLTANAKTGYVFTSWSGDLAGSTNPQSVTMSAPRSVTANFSGRTYSILPTSASVSASWGQWVA